MESSDRRIHFKIRIGTWWSDPISQDTSPPAEDFEIDASPDESAHDVLLAAWIDAHGEHPRVGMDIESRDMRSIVFWVDDNDESSPGEPLHSSQDLNVGDLVAVFGQMLQVSPSPVRADLNPQIGGSEWIVDLWQLAQTAAQAYGAYRAFKFGYERANYMRFADEREQIRDWQATHIRTMLLNQMLRTDRQWAFSDVEQRWGLTLAEASELFEAFEFELTLKKPDYVWRDMLL